MFAIYDASSGGTPPWSERPNVASDNGYFSTQLGSGTPFGDGSWGGSTRYLGVTSGTDLETTPRRAHERALCAVVGDVNIGDRCRHDEEQHGLRDVVDRPAEFK